MSDFGSNVFDRTADDAEGGKKSGVPVAWDNLGADGFWLQAQFAADMFFDGRINIGKRSNCARYGACGNFSAGRSQTPFVAIHFGVEPRECQTHCRGFGMNTVAASNANGVFMFKSAALKGGQQQIPGYHMMNKLGEGAMAKVYSAKQISLDRVVAIKVLPKKFMSDPTFVERFYAEGRAAAKLNHANIVQAYDVNQAGDFHYFAMEYVEGETVHDYLERHKQYSEEDAVQIMIEMADLSKTKMT